MAEGQESWHKCRDRTLPLGPMRKPSAPPASSPRAARPPRRSTSNISDPSASIARSPGGAASPRQMIDPRRSPQLDRAERAPFVVTAGNPCTSVAPSGRGREGGPAPWKAARPLRATQPTGERPRAISRGYGRLPPGTMTRSASNCAEASRRAAFHQGPRPRHGTGRVAFRLRYRTLDRIDRDGGSPAGLPRAYFGGRVRGRRRAARARRAGAVGPRLRALARTCAGPGVSAGGSSLTPAPGSSTTGAARRRGRSRSITAVRRRHAVDVALRASTSRRAAPASSSRGHSYARRRARRRRRPAPG